ncbi:Unknown protein, partial [Striga hermonthica]
YASFSSLSAEGSEHSVSCVLFFGCVREHCRESASRRESSRVRSSLPYASSTP